jgi:site-specific DNA-cytosine methylase
MHVDNTQQPLPILSICSGLLGIERGFERLGANTRIITYVESEAFVIANLLAGMESGILAPAPIWTDVKTLPSPTFRNKVFCITGGYPCQPFSLAGQRKGEQDPRHLWPYIQSVIQTTRPICCFFENVDDHLTLGFDTVYKDLSAMDYKVEAGVFSAREVGAPHERKRLFILAYSNGARHWRYYTRRLFAYTIAKSETRELVNTGCTELQRSLSSWYRETKSTNHDKRIPNTSSIDEQELQVEAWHTKLRELVRTGTHWPAKPNENQHTWEEPRTLSKSEMGCTINGFNFREDLLRALGNSVVEQTAALAFIELWFKMRE